MKIIILPVFFVLLMSCKQSTEDRLQSAIKRQFKESFQKKHLAIDDLSVKVLQYDITDSSSYFLDMLKPDIEYLASLGEFMRSSLKYGTDTNLRKYISDFNLQEKKVDFLQTLANQKGLPKNLYWAKYHVVYKTDEESVDKIDSTYLHIPDLQEVWVDVDSLGRRRNGD